jgi:PIN domain nuclease of toxin-antitoxin system
MPIGTWARISNVRPESAGSLVRPQRATVRITDTGLIPRDAPVVMDTHIWVWMASNDTTRISAGTIEALEEAAQDGRLLASAASVWEIALKAATGELMAGTDLHAWVAQQQETPGVRLLTITPTLAIDVTLLPAWIRRRDNKVHRDPTDRFIVASARRRGAVLATCDEAILDYADEGHVTVYDARR